MSDKLEIVFDEELQAFVLDTGDMPLIIKGNHNIHIACTGYLNMKGKQLWLNMTPNKPLEECLSEDYIEEVKGSLASKYQHTTGGAYVDIQTNLNCELPHICGDMNE